MNFANYLQSLLTQANLKAADLCRDSGLKPAHVSMFLSGNRYPSASSILILSKSLSKLTNINREEVILSILSSIEQDLTNKDCS